MGSSLEGSIGSCRIITRSFLAQSTGKEGMHLRDMRDRPLSVAVDLDRADDWKGALIGDKEFDDGIRFGDQLQTDIRRDQLGVLFLNGNRLQVRVIDG